jgi:hypothetical protein
MYIIKLKFVCSEYIHPKARRVMEKPSPTICILPRFAYHLKAKYYHTFKIRIAVLNVFQRPPETSFICLPSAPDFMILVPFDVTGSGIRLLHPPVLMFSFRMIRSSLYRRLSGSDPEDANRYSLTVPHIVKGNVCPYAPASRLNTKLTNNISLLKTFIIIIELFSMEFVPVFQSLTRHCTPSSNSPHPF